MEEASRACIEEKPDQNKAQHMLHLDLAEHRLSNGWEESPRVKKGSDSQVEFEFTMSHRMAMIADLSQPAMEVAPADELFFRGQLLPLEHDPRLQLVHTLSCINGEGTHGGQEASSAMNCATNEEKVVAKEHTSKPEPFDNDEAFTAMHRPAYRETAMHRPAYRETATGECDKDEARLSAITAESSDIVKPSRSDHVASDAFKNDSRSSSFRSQQGSYWSSGEKDCRDSSTSSRCSNGSSQDTCFYGSDQRRAPHHNMAMAHASVVCTSMSCTPANASAAKANHGKPPLPPSAKVKKWSWKGICNGLRKASSIWVDDTSDGQGHSRGTSKQKRSLFGFASAIQPRSTSPVMDSDGHIKDAGVAAELKTGARRHEACSSTWRKGISNYMYGGHASSRSYYMGSGGRCIRPVDYYEGGSINGGRPGKEKARMGIIAWNARESWQRWVKKPLRGKVRSATQMHCINMINEDIMVTNYSKSLSSTPLVKSPVRRGTASHDAEYVLGASCSSEYLHLGFAASCPVSMRSSPHHSGVLAVVSKSPPPASSVQDLHIAIQGAIAHCKQSQTSKLPP